MAKLNNMNIKKILKNKNQKGYAILFTVVIVSAISVITAGLSNTAYKQLVLSSLAKDSQSAFYQADTASDCALYIDRIIGTSNPPNVLTTGGSWTCGGTTMDVTVPVAGGNYTVYPTSANQTSSDPCFRIDVTKDLISNPGVVKTRISAKGYNICNKNNLRTVEREVVVNFEE